MNLSTVKKIKVPTGKLIRKFNKIDLLNYFIEDLFESRYPHYYKKNCLAELNSFKEKYEKNRPGIWIYYPWLNTCYRIPNENDFLEVLTSRNKPLVSAEEQRKFYSYNVGVVGLSVGQSSIITIARSGGAKNIKIADPDNISPSNLNRIHTGINSIGKKKTEEVTKKLLEINPFLNIKSYDKGINENNLEEFFNKDFKLNVIIDACDNFLIKLKIREYAQKNKIPVIMATDLGDGSLIDIERYDKKSNLIAFEGRHLKIKNTDDFLKTAVSIISPENIPLALQDRFFEIGKTTPTHPQLATSVFFSGSLVCYLVRCLANNKDIVDKRILIDFNEFFDPLYEKNNIKQIKEDRTKLFKQTLGID